MPDATDMGRRAWLFKIARNLALNHVRNGHRRPVPVELGEIVVPATQELGVAMRAAIEALPPLDRDVFLLRELAGLSYGEIATACDVTIETVRSRLHQARQALRAALGSALDVRRQRGVRCIAPARDRDST
jgi:RNA polymerase sigma-70 factor (ECF subfamily)